MYSKAEPRKDEIEVRRSSAGDTSGCRAVPLVLASAYFRFGFSVTTEFLLVKSLHAGSAVTSLFGWWCKVISESVQLRSRETVSAMQAGFSEPSNSTTCWNCNCRPCAVSVTEANVNLSLIREFTLAGAGNLTRFRP